MRIAVTGGTGLVGRFIVEDALARGDRVATLSRRAPDATACTAGLEHLPYLLGGDIPDLAGFDALVHCAFLHVPGRYRGGEGDDPEGFRRANVDGSNALFEAAAAAGVGRAVFLSSRAVYGPKPGGETLTEATPCTPESLYGEVKLAGEAALAESGLDGVSLRATGVYGPAGPGQRHKWADLFASARRGEMPAPRIGSEVHGADLATAVRLMLDTSPADRGGDVFNVSDLLLDRRELLQTWSEVTGQDVALPEAADATVFNEMDCTALRRLGWQPGGWARLRETLARMG